MENYKAVTPILTINKIRNILADVDILLRETNYDNRLFTCSVSIADESLGNIKIKSNGKGMSYRYAYASAYAEFMERLQNRILIPNMEYATKYFLNNLNLGNEFKSQITEKDLILDYLYDPNEIVLDTKNLKYDEIEMISKILSINNDLNQNQLEFFIELDFKKLRFIPFFSVKEKKVKYIPIDLIFHLCSSNGMCAGNIPEEAILQGICEIFERYVCRTLYSKKITPPTIPNTIFNGTKIIEIINELETKGGLQVIIKDCSLGIGLPVIGVLIINKQSGEYNFHLGSAISPEIAVQRCLTELYQNPEGLRLNSNTLEENYKLFNGKIDKETYEFIEYLKIYSIGVGKWPESLFQDTPNYEFKMLNNYTGITIAAELDKMINLVLKMGHELYVRDVSFLGFNSYFVYSPGLSNYSSSKNNYLFLKKLGDHTSLLDNIEDASEDDLIKLAKFFDENFEILRYLNISIGGELQYIDDNDINSLDLELFLAMLNVRINDISNAYKYICIFLNNKDQMQYNYFYCVKDFLKYKKAKNSNDEIRKLLSNYVSELIEEVFNDLSNPNKIFQYYSFPRCFKCDKCKANDKCKYLNLLSYYKRIQNKEKLNLIDQNSLKSIFKNTLQ